MPRPVTDELIEGLRIHLASMRFAIDLIQQTDDPIAATGLLESFSRQLAACKRLVDANPAPAALSGVQTPAAEAEGTLAFNIDRLHGRLQLAAQALTEAERKLPTDAELQEAAVDQSDAERINHHMLSLEVSIEEAKQWAAALVGGTASVTRSSEPPAN